MGQSSGSASTLPSSHGQANLSTLSPLSLTVTTPLFSMPSSQNFTMTNFSTPSYFSYFPFLHSTSTSLPNPPSYSDSLLPSSCNSSVEKPFLSSSYLHTTHSLSSVPLTSSYSSFYTSNSFPSLSFNPLSLPHPIY